MSRRFVAVTVLFLAFAFGMPRDSYALWGWFEQMSGPGPFKFVFGESADRLLCFAGGNVYVLGGLTPAGGASADKLACQRNDKDRVRAHLSLEFTTGKSDENVLFTPSDNETHQVRLTGLRPIFFYRLHPLAD